MTHEPECYAYCICVRLKSAYKRGRSDASPLAYRRGREDAAEAVYQAWQKFDDYQEIECQQCYTKEAFSLAEHAARGDGDQA